MPDHGERSFVRNEDWPAVQPQPGSCPARTGVNFLGFHLRQCGTQGTWLTVPQTAKVRNP